jgi:hypothetical protein
LWKRRHKVAARAVLAGALAVTAIWTFVLLDRTPNWSPWLRGLVLIAGILVAGGLLAVHLARGRAAVVLAISAVTVALAAPAGYTLSTARTAQGGALPVAGPSGTGGLGFPGGGFGGLRPGGVGGARPGGFGGPPGAPNGAAPALPGGGQAFPGGGRGGAGGLLNGSTPSAALTQLLRTNAGQYTWVAATVGANQAAGYQLATDDPIMAIGGFNGTDPTPTLAQFQQYVREGKVHYFISGGRGGGFGGGASGTSSAISAWVTANFTSQTVGGVTVYDLAGGGA